MKNNLFPLLISTPDTISLDIVDILLVISLFFKFNYLLLQDLT